ncbi:MAG TPA: hypothetical protein DHV59_02255 [Oxalobacteraceae bacterium]|nr:hypothetical protein [Oxalobacteraceae bacterium]
MDSWLAVSKLVVSKLVLSKLVVSKLVVSKLESYPNKDLYYLLCQLQVRKFCYVDLSSAS